MSHATVFDAWQTACAYTDALAVARAPAAAWREHQRLRLQDLLSVAAPRSRFYRERLDRAGRAASSPYELLERLAPVRKAELMQRFDDWVTEPSLSLAALREFTRDPARRGEAFQGRWLVWQSSGSSGEPAIFVQDARALAVADALEAARGPLSLEGPAAFGGWAGVWSPPRIALVGATEGHFASVVSFERARGLNPWLSAASRSLSFLQPIDRLTAELEAFAPTVLASYPSMAWVLSQEQAAGRMKLDLQSVWTGGETLTPALRRTLGHRFHASVHDSYGASECFLIANECRCGRLHLNADWVILEPVDRAGHPVAPGVAGATTLLTNLSNHVQPIIRYDIGDSVRLSSQACDCGSSLPAIEVQGRSDDVLTLTNARGHAVHLAPLALTSVLEDEAGVFDFQLRQREAHALALDLFGCRPRGSGHGAREAVRAGAALHEFLAGCGLANVRVVVHEHASAAARGASGKQQRVVRQTTAPARLSAARSSPSKRGAVHAGPARR